MRHVFRPSILALALPLSLGACSWLGIGGGSSNPAPKPAPTTEAKPAAKEAAKAPAKTAAKAPAPAPKPGSGLSDANIAAIVVAANNADILYADLALAKSKDTEIRAFATMVKKDHESVNEAAVALVTRLKVKPVDNQISFDLRDDAETKRLMFRDLEGFAFDSAYAANEVSYHTTVLGAIDAALIPSAQNAELKTLLVEVRPAVQAHLDHARTLAAAKTRRRR
jgi:putative membrane protein